MGFHYHSLYICVSFLNCCNKKFLKTSKDNRKTYLWTQPIDLPDERACNGLEKIKERMVVIKTLSGLVTKLYFILFFKDFIYLFLEKGEGREKGGETSMCGCLLRTPNWGPGICPWLGIKPVTLWFTGLCSIHWATPARASC